MIKNVKCQRFYVLFNQDNNSVTEKVLRKSFVRTSA